MERNIQDPLDKLLRIVIGLLTLSLVFLSEEFTRWLGLLGVVPILSALYGWCPAYALLDARSAKLERR